MKRKIRYQTKAKEKVLIKLTGQVWLKYRDEEEMAGAKKGDLMLHPYNDQLRTTRQGDYGSTGFSGYFKVDVHDGKQWCAVITNDMFPSREHHFAKSEYPVDTYELCAEILRTWKSKALQRTYREHYEPEEAVEEAQKD